MTDITINIKTGSENSEPKVTATTDNAKVVVPKTEAPKVELPKAESPKDESPKKEAPKAEAPKDESSKKDDPKKMDMTDEEHAKMGSDKTKP